VFTSLNSLQYSQSIDGDSDFNLEHKKRHSTNSCYQGYKKPQSMENLGEETKPTTKTYHKSLTGQSTDNATNNRLIENKLSDEYNDNIQIIDKYDNNEEYHENKNVFDLDMLKCDTGRKSVDVNKRSDEISHVYNSEADVTTTKSIIRVNNEPKNSLDVFNCDDFCRDDKRHSTKTEKDNEKEINDDVKELNSIDNTGEQKTNNNIKFSFYRTLTFRYNTPPKVTSSESKDQIKSLFDDSNFGNSVNKGALKKINSINTNNNELKFMLHQENFINYYKKHTSRGLVNAYKDFFNEFWADKLLESNKLPLIFSEINSINSENDLVSYFECLQKEINDNYTAKTCFYKLKFSMTKILNFIEMNSTSNSNSSNTNSNANSNASSIHIQNVISSKSRDNSTTNFTFNNNNPNNHPINTNNSNNSINPITSSINKTNNTFNISSNSHKRNNSNLLQFNSKMFDIKASNNSNYNVDTGNFYKASPTKQNSIPGNLICPANDMGVTKIKKNSNFNFSNKYFK